MSSFPIFDIAGSSLNAQSVRLNTVASNLANVDAVSGDPAAVYRARMPIFKAVMDSNNPDTASVQVQSIVENQAPPEKRYQPGHPLADQEGYVYAPNVNPVEEMVNMISSSRAYQSSVELLNTGKELALATLSLGR